MTTKMCKDCRHSAYQHVRAFWLSQARGPYERGLAASQSGAALRESMDCRHGESGDTSRVTGARKYAACASMRNDYSMPCGPAAVLWEAPDAQDS